MKKIDKFNNNIKCSECGSKDTVLINKLSYISIISIIAGCMGFAITFIIPIFWIIAPMFFIIAIAGFILLPFSLLSKKYTLRCNSCKSAFEISKNEIKEIREKNKIN